MRVDGISGLRSEGLKYRIFESGEKGSREEMMSDMAEGVCDASSQPSYGFV